jgi:hypothetical protein
MGVLGSLWAFGWAHTAGIVLHQRLLGGTIVLMFAPFLLGEFHRPVVIAFRVRREDIHATGYNECINDSLDQNRTQVKCSCARLPAYPLRNCGYVRIWRMCADISSLQRRQAMSKAALSAA